MNFEELIAKRHSTRLFQDKQISDDQLQKILEAGRIAPTAKNRQNFKIFVIQDPENHAKVDKSSPCRYNAPTCLLVCTDTSYIKEENLYEGMFKHWVIADASIVGTHMMLEAENLGVATLWVGFFNKEIIKEELNLPDNLAPAFFLMCGYEDENAPESPGHNKRKSLDELVEKL